MRRNKEIGLQISGPETRTASAIWLVPIISFSVVYGLLRLTGTQEPWLPALVGGAAAALSAWKGKTYWLYAAAAAVLVLLLFRQRFLDGFGQWYNGVGKIYTVGRGIVLPALEVSGDGWNLRLFCGWLAAVLGIGLGVLAKRSRAALSAGVLLLCAGASVALGRMIHPLPLILAALLLCSGRGWKRSVLPVGILAAVTLCAGLPGFSGWAQVRGETVRQWLHQQQYETAYTTLPEGRLEPLRTSDSTALIVTMEQPEVLYLRGYTGAQLADDRWLPLEKEILAQEQDLLYWLSSREFRLQAQFEAAASVLDTENNTVTVQNVGACSAYRYVPFTICADEQMSAENLTQTEAGERYDRFTTVYGGASLVPELLQALGAEDSRYLRAEAAYREFVRAHYLDIPGELAEAMEPYWEKVRGMDPQNAVRAVLEDCFPEGVGRDPYYATAAVLTLRHFGIPARYAEGYILPQTQEQTVALTGQDAACWAEVYQDGIGWMPMALTPGLSQESRQEEQTQPPDPPEETMPPETEPVTEPESDGGYQVRLRQTVFRGVILASLLVLLVAAGLLLRRKIILNKRQALLDQEDNREAVLWSFADSVGLLQRMGFHRGTGSLDALIVPLRERFGEGFAEGFEAAARIHAKALFSGKPITQPERDTVQSFRRQTLELLQKHSGRLTRLWMKYVLCVY